MTGNNLPGIFAEEFANSDAEQQAEFIEEILTALVKEYGLPSEAEKQLALVGAMLSDDVKNLLKTLVQ
jgi:ribosomal protein S16